VREEPWCASTLRPGEAYGVLSDVTLSGVVQFLRIKAAVIRNDFHVLPFKCETFPLFDV